MNGVCADMEAPMTNIRPWSEKAFIYTGSDLSLLYRQMELLRDDLRIVQSKNLLVYCLDHDGIHYISGEFPDDETPSMTRARFWPTKRPEFEAIIVNELGNIKKRFNAPVTVNDLSAFLGQAGFSDESMS